MASIMDDHMVSPKDNLLVSNKNCNIVPPYTSEQRNVLMADIENTPSDDESLNALLLQYFRGENTPAKKKKAKIHISKKLAHLGPSRLSKRLLPRCQKQPITYSP